MSKFYLRRNEDDTGGNETPVGVGVGAPFIRRITYALSSSPMQLQAAVVVVLSVS